MTEFLGAEGGQIACEVTGLTAAAEEVVAARPACWCGVRAWSVRASTVGLAAVSWAAGPRRAGLPGLGVCVC
jgi:hypothetical protein